MKDSVERPTIPKKDIGADIFGKLLIQATAFGAIVTLHKEVYTECLKEYGNKEDAHAATQDIMVAIMRSASKGE